MEELRKPYFSNEKWGFFMDGFPWVISQTDFFNNLTITLPFKNL